MTEYVLGFAFAPHVEANSHQVLLILKLHGPQVLHGRWNGLGGKIEAGESSAEAMAREAKEEANLDVPAYRWLRKATISGLGFYIHVFVTFVDEGVLDQAKKMTDEPIAVFDANFLPDDHELAPNLKWLVPMVRSEKVFASVELF